MYAEWMGTLSTWGIKRPMIYFFNRVYAGSTFNVPDIHRAA